MKGVARGLRNKAWKAKPQTPENKVFRAAGIERFEGIDDNSAQKRRKRKTAYGQRGKDEQFAVCAFHATTRVLPVLGWVR